MLLVVTLILAQAELNVKRLLARMVARHKGISLKPVTFMWINSGEMWWKSERAAPVCYN